MFLAGRTMRYVVGWLADGDIACDVRRGLRPAAFGRLPRPNVVCHLAVDLATFLLVGPFVESTPSLPGCPV